MMFGISLARRLNHDSKPDYSLAGRAAFAHSGRMTRYTSITAFNPRFSGIYGSVADYSTGSCCAPFDRVTMLSCRMAL